MRGAKHSKKHLVPLLGCSDGSNVNVIKHMNLQTPSDGLGGTRMEGQAHPK
jgi:hypothetical protein